MEMNVLTTTSPIQEKITTLLRNEAKTNKKFNAVCTIFAVRQRTRAQVTARALTQAMLLEGFTDFTIDDAAKVINFLGSLEGLGTIVNGRKKENKSLALVNIKYTLQSVGATALGEKAHVELFLRKQQEFKKLQTPKFTRRVIRRAKGYIKPPMISQPELFSAKISGQVGEGDKGRFLEFPLTREEFKRFLDQIINSKKF